MSNRNIQLIMFGAAGFLAGTIMLYFTSFDPQSAYAGYALALHLGGLAVASIGINDETQRARRAARKDRSRR
ncbi:hypothetical protein QP786_00260 [Gleimia europaea]|nr:hypothetical protein [Gleimia europaea]MDK8534654.1 hypothetical protein [Gleimia europaea]